MASPSSSRVPDLPNEVIHHIFESLWSIISTHPGRDYAAIPPSPSHFYSNFLLVNKTWHQLAIPFFIRWWSTTRNPGKILEYVKGKNAGPLVRHVTMGAWPEIGSVEIPLRVATWRGVFGAFTHLTSVSVRVDALDRKPLPTSVAANNWLKVCYRTLSDLPLEQRARFRKLNLQFANDLVLIEDSDIHQFAEALPNVSSLLLQGFGPPTESGELIIRNAGRVSEEESAWWTGLRHFTALHFQCQHEADETSVITSILAASFQTLLSFTAEEVVSLAPTPLSPAAPLSDVLGTPEGEFYPRLERLSFVSPPLTQGQEVVFSHLPALRHLSIAVAAGPGPNSLPAARPSLLKQLPRDLTHLTLSLDTLHLWVHPLIDFIINQKSLKYLSIDQEDPPDSPLRLLGILPISHAPQPLQFRELSIIADLCQKHGVLFASADERLWGGDAGLWHLASDDEMASESSGVGSSGVEEMEDFDAEDDAIWASKWSADKRRDMAVVHLCEALKLDLRAGVQQDEIRRAIEPFLQP